MAEPQVSSEQPFTTVDIDALLDEPSEQMQQLRLQQQTRESSAPSSVPVSGNLSDFQSEMRLPSAASPRALHSTASPRQQEVFDRQPWPLSLGDVLVADQEIDHHEGTLGATLREFLQPQNSLGSMKYPASPSDRFSHDSFSPRPRLSPSGSPHDSWRVSPSGSKSSTSPSFNLASLRSNSSEHLNSAPSFRSSSDAIANMSALAAQTAQRNQSPFSSAANFHMSSAASSYDSHLHSHDSGQMHFQGSQSYDAPASSNVLSRSNHELHRNLTISMPPSPTHHAFTSLMAASSAGPLSPTHINSAGMRMFVAQSQSPQGESSHSGGFGSTPSAGSPRSFSQSSMPSSFGASAHSNIRENLSLQTIGMLMKCAANSPPVEQTFSPKSGGSSASSNMLQSPPRVFVEHASGSPRSQVTPRSASFSPAAVSSVPTTFGELQQQLQQTFVADMADDSRDSVDREGLFKSHQQQHVHGQTQVQHGWAKKAAEHQQHHQQEHQEEKQQEQEQQEQEQQHQQQQRRRPQQQQQQQQQQHRQQQSPMQQQLQYQQQLHQQAQQQQQQFLQLQHQQQQQYQHQQQQYYHLQQQFPQQYPQYYGSGPQHSANFPYGMAMPSAPRVLMVLVDQNNNVIAQPGVNFHPQYPHLMHAGPGVAQSTNFVPAVPSHAFPYRQQEEAFPSQTVPPQSYEQQPRQQRMPATFVNPATSQYQPHATTSQTLPQNPSQSQTRKESSHTATLQRGGTKHAQQSGESSLRSFPVPRVSGSCITKYTPGSDRVIDVAVDQQGSRLIQTRLSSGPPDVVSAIVNEIIDDLMVLTMDVFGNYVVQKAFEHADSAQQQRVGSMLVGNVFNLSVHVYGCRVLQKVLEVFDVQFHSLIVGELVAGLLNECVCDPNGNHVVQKAIELASPALLQPVVDTLRKDVFKFSTHLYGCRVMQRVLEYCVSEQSAPVLQLIVESGSELLCDQFGNYVVQHVIECGPPHARSSLLQLMCGNLPELAVHKFASNVVEKVLRSSSPSDVVPLIAEFLTPKRAGAAVPLQAVMRDQYGNYVIQCIIDISQGEQRQAIAAFVLSEKEELKKYSYGKHILAHLEKCMPDSSRSQPRVANKARGGGSKGGGSGR